MLKKPLVSILINNYNYASFLDNAIKSTLEQTYSNIEVIVVDDGSTDNSREVIASYEDKIVAVLQENGGQASAFNAGFLASKGEYIFLLDSDDYMLPSKAAEIANIFNNNPEADWCFHRQKLVNTKGESISNEDDDCELKPDRMYDLRKIMPKGGNYSRYLPSYGIPATSALCFRRRLLAKILPMPETELKILSDNYIKELALALSPGYITSQQLTMQTIHGQNAYTHRLDNSQIAALIFLQTAYWIRAKFPWLSRHTNNNVAMALAINKLSKVATSKHEKIAARYLTESTLIDKILIYAKTIYYQLKWKN